MKLGSIEFMGRAYFIDDQIIDLECWCHELDPMELSKRSGSEWAKAHLQESYSITDLREVLDLPLEGDYQVLFTAKLTGVSGWTDYGDEYDEDLDILTSSHAAIPKEYAAMLVQDDLDSRNY